MRIVVLAKAVADRSRLRRGPGGATERTPADSFLNPFDQRALRVALDLRTADDRASVVSVGPPWVATWLAPLREAGFDRVRLLSDEALAGSDLGSTARALAAAARPLAPDLLLLGERATDSEVGALPALLAGALGLPFVSHADRIERLSAPGSLRVRTGSDEASAEYAVPTPCVIGVGEKIAKPLKPPPVAPDRGEALVERMALAELGVPAERLGRVGSSWVLGETIDLAIPRAPVLYASAEVRRAVDAARSLATERRDRRPSAPASSPAGDVRGPLAILLTGPEGEIDRRISRVLPAIRAWLPDLPLVGLAIGSGVRAAVDRIVGLSEIYEMRSSLRSVPPASAARGVGRLIDERSDLRGIAFVDTDFGRDVAGRLAGERDLPLVTGVEHAREGPDGIGWWKESWGSTALVEVRARRPMPLATIRTPREPSGPAVGLAAASVRPLDGRIEGAGVTTLSWARRERPELGEIETAPLLFVVGQGIGGPEAIDRLAAASARLERAIAGTRRVVDAGWLPLDRQIGLTGHSLAPRVAFLLGVSGSPNHLIGLRRARAIVAVNPDPAAPVFRAADIGIVGRVDDVLAELLAAVE